MSGLRRGRVLLNSWHTALRVGLRETRRARGRSALVVAMIAVPVLALSFAAVTYDMFTLTQAEELDRRLGGADAEVTWVTDSPITQDVGGNGWSDDVSVSSRPTIGLGPPAMATSDMVAALLPPGSRLIPLDLSSVARVSTDAASHRIDVRRFDATDPLARGLVVPLAGRLPTGPDELALTRDAARRFRVGIGDRIDVEEIGQPLVVGLVEFPDNLGEAALAWPRTDANPARTWLVGVPGQLDWALVRQLNRHGVLVASRSVVLAEPTATARDGMLPEPGDNREVLSFGVLAGGLGLLEVVLLAGPAFAVGARRRRRDLALVAANGGTLAQLRRIVLADGIVLGVTGALVGTVLGVTVAVVGRPLVEEYVAASRAGGYRFNPTALLTIAGLAVAAGVLACLVPAYSAARQDVVETLNGRRGVVRSRRRWLVTGLVLAGAGGGTAAYGATRVNSDLILTGLVLGELGLVLCTPSLVGVLARLGRLLPPAPRIALRDTARNRAAAAPAISAVMAAVAGSVALGCYIASEDARSMTLRQPVVPMGYVSVSYDIPMADTDPVPAGRVAEVARRSGLAVAEVAPIREPGCPAEIPSPARSGTSPQASATRYCTLTVQIPPERWCPYLPEGVLTRREQRLALADPRCAEPPNLYYSPVATDVVDDGTALPLLTGAHGDDLRRARATLAAGGVVVTDPRQLRDGTVTVEVTRLLDGVAEPSPTVTVTLPGHLLTTGISAPRAFYSPAALARTGLAAQPWGYIVATDAVPNADVQERFATAVRRLAPDLQVDVERGATSSDRPTLVVLAIAAGTITIGAAAIATGLAAADGRADLTTLAAVGAAPRMRRSLSLSQSGVIAGLGSLLGIGAGLGAGFAILAALNQTYATTWPTPAPYPVTVPWPTLGILFLVPVVAMLGAGLLTRSRLPIERRRD